MISYDSTASAICVCDEGAGGGAGPRVGRAGGGGTTVRPAGGGGCGGDEAGDRDPRLGECAGRVEFRERGVVRAADATGGRGTAAPPVAASELGGGGSGRGTVGLSQPGRVC